MPRTDPRQRTADTPISRARLAAGMTQAELAKAVGCGQKDVSRWENGKSVPKTENLAKLAKILNCSMENLLK